MLTREILRFTPRAGLPVRRERNGQTILSAELKDGTLIVSLYTDFKPEPLLLAAPAGEGCGAKLVLYPCRAELYVDGALRDEEWPACPYTLEGTIAVGGDSAFSAEYYEKQEESAVLREFVMPPLWQPEENVYVGDCMPYVHGDRYHVLYLKDRHRHGSKHGLGAHQWYHISTQDFVTWQEHPAAVPIDDAREGSICTGSHIYRGGTHYLYYTVRTCDRSPAPLMRSVSQDGYHFEKDPGFRFTLSDRYTGASARDPKIAEVGGKYHILLTTSLAREGKGCLAHLSSRDLVTWQEEEPLYVSETRDEPECSDLFFAGGWWCLIYSLKGRAYCRVSREPFAGYFAADREPLPCGNVPKCAVYRGVPVFTGFLSPDGRYAGGMVFMTARVLPDGRLETRSFSPGELTL